MDPNYPGQGPGDPIPPPAPPYGVPPTPSYGDPTQPPYGGAPYGAPPPSWGTPTPSTPRIPLPRIIAAVVVVVAIAIAGFYAYNLVGGQRGKIVFSTDVPVAGTTCAVSNQVSSVSAATPVYANYIWASKLGSETVTVTITKDAQAFEVGGLTQIDFPAATAGTDCFSDITNLSELPGWGPGTFRFSATSGGSIVAKGDLTVK